MSDADQNELLLCECVASNWYGGHHPDCQARKQFEALQAEEERLLRILRGNVNSEVWEHVITGVEVDVDGYPC